MHYLVSQQKLLELLFASLTNPFSHRMESKDVPDVEFDFEDALSLLKKQVEDKLKLAVVSRQAAFREEIEALKAAQLQHTEQTKRDQELIAQLTEKNEELQKALKNVRFTLRNTVAFLDRQSNRQEKVLAKAVRVWHATKTKRSRSPSEAGRQRSPSPKRHGSRSRSSSKSMSLDRASRGTRGRSQSLRSQSSGRRRSPEPRGEAPSIVQELPTALVDALAQTESLKRQGSPPRSPLHSPPRSPPRSPLHSPPPPPPNEPASPRLETAPLPSLALESSSGSTLGSTFMSPTLSPFRALRSTSRSASQGARSRSPSQSRLANDVEDGEVEEHSKEDGEGDESSDDSSAAFP